MGAAMAGGIPQNPMQQASMAQQGALAGTAMGMGYNPQQVQTRFGSPMVGTGGTTPSVSAGQLSSTNLSPYMNPYTQNVIGGLQQEAARGMQIGANQLGAQATQAGAFGGSRHGIAQGQMMGDIMRGLNQQTGQLLQSGFQNAQQMAQQDIATRMQAQQLNQSAAAQDLARQLQAQGMNQSAIQQAQQMGLQGQLANQTAGLQGAQQRLGAAAQLGNLGQQSFGYGQQIQQNLAQQGQQQQLLNQALIDAAKSQYSAYQQAPTSGLSIMTQALGASPHGQTQTSQSSPGLFGMLSAGLSAAPYLFPSDVRLKTNIKVIGELDSGLKTYSWDWNAEGEKLTGEKSNSGVIAQEVAEMFPEAVITGDHGYMMVDYSHPELRGAL